MGKYLTCCTFCLHLLHSLHCILLVLNYCGGVGGGGGAITAWHKQDHTEVGYQEAAANLLYLFALQRFLLWQLRNTTIAPFGETAQQVFARISAARDFLDGAPQSDQGIVNTDPRT